MSISNRKRIAASAKQFQASPSDINNASEMPPTKVPDTAHALKKKSKEIYQQKLKNRELAAARKQQKKAARENRSRILMHAGGLMEMTGLLRYCFADAEEFDNPQDNLRANLLVGSLLHLSEYLNTCSPEELSKISAQGKLFRKSDRSARPLSETNPSLKNAKAVRPLLAHEAQGYKSRDGI